MTNVAYSKPVTLSSHYDYTSRHAASNAVNGHLTDLTATAAERFPWLRIDFDARFRIHEIEVFARIDYCGHYFVFIFHD